MAKVLLNGGILLEPFPNFTQICHQFFVIESRVFQLKILLFEKFIFPLISGVACYYTSN